MWYPKNSFCIDKIYFITVLECLARPLKIYHRIELLFKMVQTTRWLRAQNIMDFEFIQVGQI
jgi:hypothetical protein